MRPADSGVSSPVYRLDCGAETFYLRLSETPEASLGPEVQVHGLLRDRGVKVPEVIYFEPFDEGLQRSVLVTTEIPGESIARSARVEDTATVAREAGRDLARINSVPVEGFGWIRRDHNRRTKLTAQYSTAAEWRQEYVEAVERVDRAGALLSHETDAVRRNVEDFFRSLPCGPAWLAHGDLDVTHIYHRGGRYTGIIDLGEIRGANRLYDLGHFLLHDGESVPIQLFAHLLSGYTEIAPMSSEAEREIRLSALAIGVRALARSLRHPSAGYQRWLLMRVRELLPVS